MMKLYIDHIFMLYIFPLTKLHSQRINKLVLILCEYTVISLYVQ